MSTAKSIYAMGLEATKDSIKFGGHNRTILVEGHMGTGKSTLLWMLDEELPTHKAFYFDCTTKTDAGDIGLPHFNKIEEDGCVTYVPNEELGLHLDQPIILMIDEFGKANQSVKNGCLRLMLERKWGSKDLHPESIIFATTNMGAEGVGDLLKPHERNRISVVRSRKPDADEWIAWGLNNGIHPTVLGWANDNPHIFQSFEDVENPEDNQYIFHPQQQRSAFVTPRSLHAASDWLYVMDDGHITNNSLTAILMGTIGERAAMDMMAFVTLSNELPSLESIKSDPMLAKIPDSAAGTCMVVFRTLSTIDKDWMDAWMVYMSRLETEAQGMFVNGVRAKGFKKQSIVMTNKKFTEWALAHKHLYSADKV